MTAHTVLVIEDEPALARLAQEYLARDGFDVDYRREGATTVFRLRLTR